MPFPELTTMLDGRCPVVVKGHTYFVEQPSVRDGINLTLLLNDPETDLTDREEYAQIRRLLGPVWDEMGRNGVGKTLQMFAGRVAMIWYGIGPGQAVVYAQRGYDDPSGGPLPSMPRWQRGRTFHCREHMDLGILAAGRGSNPKEFGNGSTTPRWLPRIS